MDRPQRVVDQVRPGLSPYKVSKMVGHATLAMIEQRYGHLIHDELQDEMDRLEAVE